VPDNRIQLPLDPIAEAARLWREHGWDDAADGMAAITSLMRAQRIALTRVEATLKPFDVTFARYEVLMLLTFSRSPSLPMSVIGTRLQVHPTSVTNAVDRLQESGLVERVANPNDRRTTLVAITAAGRKVAGRATKRLNADVFGQPGISSADARRLVTLLTRMRVDAGDFAPRR
jgi:DNA-binding MarR family transcriptional regulator